MNRSVTRCSSPACNFNDLFINCKGSCLRRFHAVCVGLSAEDVPTITSSSNLFWFCDDCRDDILSFRGAVWPHHPEQPPGEEECCRSAKCIFTDKLIRCEGPCGKDFHGMCVRLNRTDLAVIGSSVNILWICDECKGTVRDASGEELVEGSVGQEPGHQDVDDSMVVRLETKFESIIQKLTRLSNNIECGVYTPSDSLSNSARSSGDEDSLEMNDTVVEFGVISNRTDSKATEVEDTELGSKTPDSSTNKDEPKAEESPKQDFPKLSIFTFGSAKQFESPTANLSFSFSKSIDYVEKFKTILEEQQNRPPKPKPAKPIEPQKDENNNFSKPQETAPEKVELAPPPIQLAKRVDSKFALWIKFDDPTISSREACSMIRQALGMSAREPISARNVVPGHIRFTGQASYASFKVDMDAFWRKKALDGETWQLVEDYMEHAEWVDRW